MAGDWMKIELELSDKPEVHYIAGALGLDPDAVVGKLIRVWAWFDKHTTDGNAHGVTFSTLDRITCVAGFGEAMQFAGWLEQRDKVLVMPKFERHTSKSAKKRALTSRRVAKTRNAPVTQSVTPAALPREEKNKSKSATPSASDFKADLFARWKALPDGGGGAFLTALFRDHKPEQAVIEAVERTLDHAPADPKAFVKGLLRKGARDDDDYAALMRKVK